MIRSPIVSIRRGDITGTSFCFLSLLKVIISEGFISSPTKPPSRRHVPGMTSTNEVLNASIQYFSLNFQFHALTILI